jgi:hypothetical protein
MNLHVLTPHDAFTRADGVDVDRQAQIVTKKALNFLENKLDKLLQQKSVVTNRNEELKKLINHSRKLRLQTDISHTKLVESLAEYRKKIETMLAESTEVYTFVAA